ncbi:hypothetical protein Rleg_0638 [Rhizobium leguminosarum bv. trifolii WSM1325]|uniref:DUF3592 domain-containing protein n=2 Tax=Rhizobium/Agrobacterium group TaxID=227290 RepID=C6B3M1_RHILS|nr:hypothetical protein [Rhizobium leguminosarum]ACS54942.1 hypothetical protein Rleg_0638 [Rhizobium leguminosarum bv. trifolii WSM1325]
MLRHTYNPKVTRELAVMRVVFPLVGLLICIAILGFYLWRLHHFERTVATIEAVWEEEVHRRGVKIVTMAELSFSRTTPTGESIVCRYNFEIGTPHDDFNIGDKLDIVPATGTCQRADIIGKSEPNL